MNGKALLPLVLPLLTMTGCGKVAAAIAGMAASSAQAGMSDSEKLASKLSLYAQCTNASRRSAFDVLQRYQDYLNADGTPKNEGSKPSSIELGEYVVDPCKAAVEQGPGQEPSLPELEKAQADYTAALTDLADVSNQLHKYYDQEDFKDDDWAKSKELVPKALEAGQRFGTANTALDELLDAKEDEANEAMLAHLEDTVGKNAEYHTRVILGRAKKFLVCLEGETIDVAGCEAPFEALEKAHGEFDTYTTDNKASVDQITLFSWFEDSEEEYFVESKKLMRALRDGQAEPEALDPVLEAYNDLIDNSNRVHFPAS